MSASAGSGKTEVLARRCLSLIADDGCEVERLLVVTFTRAAAAELRARIGGMLHRRLSTAGAAMARAARDHLRRQIALLDAADICTLDSWCNRVVRDHFAAAGVDPNFSVLDEDAAKLLRHEVLDQVFNGIYADDGGGDLATAVRDWLDRSAYATDDFLRTMVLELSEFLDHLVFPQRWLDEHLALGEQGDAALWDDAQRMLADALADECVAQVEGLGELIREDDDSPPAEALRRYRESLADWAERLRRSPAALLEVSFAIEGIVRPGKGCGKGSWPTLDEVDKYWYEKRLKKRWGSQSVQRMLDSAAAVAPLGATLIRLVRRYRDQLAESKRARGGYEFGDVERFALNLLGGDEDNVARPPSAGYARAAGRPPSAGSGRGRPGYSADGVGDGPRRPSAIARELAARYDHILVDEYQDTSPVQTELLRLVTRESGNRFMVGDVKQSIYGFRHAEPRLFVDLLEAFESGRQPGVGHYLADNFRSHAGLLEGLNGMFAALFDPALGGSRYGERERLCARREEVDNRSLDGGARIELHIIEQQRGRKIAPDDDFGDDDVELAADAGAAAAAPRRDDPVLLKRVEREAVLAAEQIRRMLASGVNVPERAPGGGLGLRPIRLSDVVILLRSAAANAPLAAGVLRGAGIACITSGRDALLDSNEAADLRSVLALLANRRQDLPMAAYLRGPLVGLSADELLDIRRQRPKGAFADAATHYARKGPDDDLRRKLRDALQQLDRWLEVSRNVELPALLLRIERDGGLEPFARALQGGRHRVALLRALRRYAAAFAESGRHGPGEFIEYLEDLAARKLEPESAASGGEEVVRIMTIHGSKGLEFPVVFLLNAGAEFHRQSPRSLLHQHERLGLGLKFLDYAARTRLVSPRHHLIRTQAVYRDRQEEMRLLYVAATRAREKLIVIGHSSPGDWDEIRGKAAGLSGRPPLVSLQNARSALEWCMWGAAATLKAHGDRSPCVDVLTHDADGLTDARPASQAGEQAAPEWKRADQAWVDEGLRLLNAPLDLRLATMPAVLSASAIKSRAFEAAREGQPERVERPIRHTSLRLPDFAARDGTGGTQRGTALHRFMQHAELNRLETADAVCRQLDDFVASRLLTDEEAGAICTDDIVWFAATPVGRELASAAQADSLCHTPDGSRADGQRRAQRSLVRELPFVFSLPVDARERVVVRGIIDCLYETPAGLVLLDYKTDRLDGPRLDDELAQRLRGYERQLQIYAWAAAEIARRPVARGVLAMLALRRIVEVPLVRPAMSELLQPQG